MGGATAYKSIIYQGGNASKDIKHFAQTTLVTKPSNTLLPPKKDLKRACYVFMSKVLTGLCKVTELKLISVKL